MKPTEKNTIRKFQDNYSKALKLDYVEKPLSWALYQTWKAVNSIEEVRDEQKQTFKHNT